MDGWGITRGFDLKFCPQDRVFDLIEVRCISIGNVLHSQIIYVSYLKNLGINGYLRANLSPRVGNLIFMEGQIPTISPSILG